MASKNQQLFLALPRISTRLQFVASGPDTLPTGVANAGSALDRLRDAIGRTSTEPYLLSVTEDGLPHCVTVSVTWDEADDHLSLGAPSLGEVTPHPGRHVSLLWPPAERGGYSLIVDGVSSAAAYGGEPAPIVLPTKAVLHRGQPAPRARVSSCPNDCIVIFQR